MYKYNFYLKEARFLGVESVKLDTFDTNEAKKLIADIVGCNVDELTVWLCRDYC